MVAKAVAGTPTCTDRLEGRTEAASDWAQLGEASRRERTETAHKTCGTFFDIEASSENTQVLIP
jgi:hypothetical protein